MYSADLYAQPVRRWCFASRRQLLGRRDTTHTAGLSAYRGGLQDHDGGMQRATDTACWLSPLVDERRVQQEGHRILSSHHGARPDLAMRSQACAMLNALPEILQDGIEGYIALLTGLLSVSTRSVGSTAHASRGVFLPICASQDDDQTKQFLA